MTENENEMKRFGVNLSRSQNFPDRWPQEGSRKHDPASVPTTDMHVLGDCDTLELRNYVSFVFISHVHCSVSCY